MFTSSFVSKRATAVCHTLTLKGGLVQPSRRGSDTAHCGTASITPVPHSVELLLLHQFHTYPTTRLWNSNTTLWYARLQGHPPPLLSSQLPPILPYLLPSSHQNIINLVPHVIDRTLTRPSSVRNYSKTLPVVIHHISNVATTMCCSPIKHVPKYCFLFINVLTIDWRRSRNLQELSFSMTTLPEHDVTTDGIKLWRRYQRYKSKHM